MASPPLSPPHSDFSFHIDPHQHPSDPAVVPGQNDIAISAVEPSTLNAMAPAIPSTSPLSSASISPSPSLSLSLSPAVRNVPPVPRFLSMDSVTSGAPSSDKPNSSTAAIVDDDQSSSSGSTMSAAPEASGPSEAVSAPSAASAPISPASVVSRKLPPVPKFNADETTSKPDSVSRGLMGPPPVPKFHSSSSDIAARPPGHDILGVVTDSSSSGERHNEALDLGITLGNEEKQTEEQTEAVTSAVAPGAVASATMEIVDDVVGSEGQNADVGEEMKSKESPQAAAAGSFGTSPSLPYSKPTWSAAPGHPYTLEILKEGTMLGVEDVSKKAAYMFGRSDRCDFVLEHPTVSRYHAVLQYNAEGGSFLYDLGSTHGTFVNKVQVEGKAYVPLHVGDIVRFGHSSRLHIFQGPTELMPKEGLSKKDRLSRRLVDAAQDRAIQEASIMRGKRDAMTADGVSWGMQEDAEEEEEENEDEITWQTFKGQLTEKQQKTLEKVHKHNEKLSNLKKENDSIQAKEGSQGGLTQGQQTQVARNEQRMEQLVEEVENLEETLNESIRESISGRAGRPRPGKRNRLDNEDTDEDSSDDEFYDRAGKSQTQKRKETALIVETTESLLDKKAVIVADIEALRKELKNEQEQSVSSTSEESKVPETAASNDPLDQFMTTLSSNILKDRSAHIEKELDSSLRALERVERLIKIADPTNDGLRKWEQKQAVEGKQPHISTKVSKLNRRILSQKEDVLEHSTSGAAEPVDVNGGSSKTETQADSLNGAREPTKADGGGDSPSKDDVTPLPGLEPPLRLGAPTAEPSEEAKPEYSDKVNEEAEKFITYKERNKAKTGAADVVAIPKEAAVPTDRAATEFSDAKEDTSAADSVALLLRHKRGLGAEDDVRADVESDSRTGKLEESMTSKKSKKRKSPGLPKSSQPTYTEDTSMDWVPPTGQTGDGRTALNDKYGY